jgi:AmiR/NasT family two-component response regulator
MGTMLRVLIAEDELILAYVMRGQLEQRGVEVVGLTASGRATLEQCQQARPDVVLMDVRMPETDGIEGTRLIMQDCPTCVIVVTAYSDEQTMAKAEAAGAMGFLSKPIQAAAVLEAIPQAQARFAEFEAIQAEARDLAEALETRMTVERAKAMLVAAGEADMANAFQVLKERAARARSTLRAMAESLIRGAGNSGSW